MAGQTKATFWLQYLQNLVSVFGLIISAYSLYVELYSAENPNYKPMCDLHTYISCSKALNSRFGTGLGLVAPILGDDHWLNQKNAAYGFGMYTFLLIIGTFNSIRAATIYYWITVVINALTVYLAVVLLYLQTFCIVCVSIYVINGILFLLARRRLNLLSHIAKKKRH